MIRIPGLLALGGLLIASAGSRPLGAQHPVVLETGFSGVHFVDDDASVFGPSLRLALAGRSGALFGSGEAGTLATLGAASAYAVVEGGVRSDLRRPWSAELSGELSTVAASKNSAGAGTALLGGRIYRAFEHAGGWLRATAHGSARTNTTLGGGGADAGVWWTFARARVTATIAHERTNAELFSGRFRTGFVGTVPVRYTEAGASLHLEGDWTTLDVAASSRRDPDAAKLYDASATAIAAVWLRRSTALVFTASRQLPDWVHGSDAASVYSLALRFYQPTPAVERLARMLPLAQVADSAGARYLRVRAPGATAVDVMGDFTDWDAQPMARRGDVFERVVALPSGSHRLMIRIDGGAWRTAVNTPAVDDDLGGRVGLLVVP